MIAEIFLPEKMGSRRLISRRIVGITIHDDCVQGTSVYAKQSKTAIESFASIKLEEGTEETLQQRTVQALKKLIALFKKYDHIRIAIPATIVTFKELQVPFIDPEKIKMVLAYEIEGMLPFAVNEAIIDFIITKKDLDKKSSQILVAAVRKQDLQAILDLYTQADIIPTSITIDLFAAYNLYQQITEYCNITNASALIDVGHYATRIAFLQKGELRLTRSIPRGIINIAQDIAQELNVPLEQIIAKLHEQGISISQDEATTKILQKHFINFFHDIQFTLNSFSLKLNFYEGIGRLLFIGKALLIPGLMKFSADTLQIPTEAFDSKKILLSPQYTYTLKDSSIDWSTYAITLGVALPSEAQELFDLRKNEFTLMHRPIIIKQAITAIIVIVSIIGFISFNGYVQINKLKDALDSANNKAISQLKNIIPKEKQAKKLTLTAMVKEAEKVLQERTELWASFSDIYKLNPLRIFLELTTLLEKYNDELTILEITINSQENNEIHVTLEGYFKSKKGSGFHFGDWANLDAKFREQPNFFTLINEPDTSADGDKGIRITVNLKVTMKEK